MFLSDSHTHTILSPDGHVPLSEMARAAVDAGLNVLTVTDHCDLLTGDGQRDLTYDWAPSLAQYRQTAPLFQGGLDLRLGIELGEAFVSPDHARAILAAAGDALDQVIGSIHNWREENGGGEYFYTRFRTPEICRAALEDYFTSMEELITAPDCYDVLGHIIYPTRYMHRDGCTVDLMEDYRERLAEILRQVIKEGRSIEVNTCRGNTVEDWRGILHLYKDLGGTMVTTGSDAHRTADMAKGIREANALLLACGFDRVTVYKHRKPELKSI